MINYICTWSFLTPKWQNAMDFLFYTLYSHYHSNLFFTHIARMCTNLWATYLTYPHSGFLLNCWIFVFFRSLDWQSLMLALIRLLHCLNCVKEIPSHHSLYANLLSCSSMTLTSEELQQNLKNSIAGIQEIYGSLENNVGDGSFVKYCFSEILQCLWSLPDTGTEKGEMHNAYNFTWNSFCKTIPFPTPAHIV